MKRIIGLLSALGMLAFAVPSAVADAPEKGWICHGTGAEGNPFVLVEVPLNSAHWEKHLPDGVDKVPFEVEGGHSCTSPDSDPDPPFNGKITFTLNQPDCPAGTVGVPGFTVTQEGRGHGQVEVFENGQVTETVIFVYPFTCIPLGAGTQGAAGSPGTNTTTIIRQGPTRCVSRRAFVIRLPRSYAGLRRVRARVGGVKRTLPVTNRRVRVVFRGRKNPGIYAVVIHARGKRPVRRLYALCNGGNVQDYNLPIVQ